MDFKGTEQWQTTTGFWFKVFAFFITFAEAIWSQGNNLTQSNYAKYGAKNRTNKMNLSLFRSRSLSLSLSFSLSLSLVCNTWSKKTTTVFDIFFRLWWKQNENLWPAGTKHKKFFFCRKDFFETNFRRSSGRRGSETLNLDWQRQWKAEK